MNPSAQIFISHSSKDEELIDLIEALFKDRGITPYFARRHIAGKNPAQKIIFEIGNSITLFALITSNVLFDQKTRDWVVFEIGVAKGRKMPVFAWVEKAHETSVPELLSYITDYDTFDPLEHKERLRIVKAMVDKAIELKREAEKPKMLKVVEEKRKKIKPEYVEEIIEKHEKIGEIYHRIVERAGGPDFAGLTPVRIDLKEQREFEALINWLAEKYPTIAPDTKRAMRMEYLIRYRRIKDYDPILQICNKSSLKNIFSRAFEVRFFEQHWSAGRALLRAYLGIIKEK